MESATQRLADWERRYRAGDTAWERGSLHPAFLHWAEHGALGRALSSPGRVLVPGAGRCPEVVEFARRGFSVTAVDIAPTPANAARDAAATNPNGLAIDWVEADLLGWDAPAPFDWVYEQTCLCALHPDYWEAYAARLTRWTRVGGRLLALFVQRESEGGPPYHCELAAMQRLFSRGWAWPDHRPRRYPHPAGIAELAIALERVPI